MFNLKIIKISTETVLVKCTNVEPLNKRILQYCNLQEASFLLIITSITVIFLLYYITLLNISYESTYL